MGMSWSEKMEKYMEMSDAQSGSALWLSKMYLQYPIVMRNVTIGFDCPKHWRGPVQEAIAGLEKIAKSTDPSLRIVQVKEKFGGLRIYVESTTTEKHPSDNINMIISYAENKCHNICINCVEHGEHSVAWGRRTCSQCKDFP